MDIKDLIKEYEAEHCTFDNKQTLEFQLKRYMNSMEDSHFKCVLYSYLTKFVENPMNRDKCKKILENGGNVSVEGLWFSSKHMTCGEGCCDDNFETVDKALEQIYSYAGYDWKNVVEE